MRKKIKHYEKKKTHYEKGKTKLNASCFQVVNEYF